MAVIARSGIIPVAIPPAAGLSVRSSSVTSAVMPIRLALWPAGMVYRHPSWSGFGTMPVNLSIKNAPDRVVRRLRERAERHHRSLQGELLAIIEAAVQEDRPATPAEILAEVRRLGLQTPSEAAALVRADRDDR